MVLLLILLLHSAAQYCGKYVDVYVYVCKLSKVNTETMT